MINPSLLNEGEWIQTSGKNKIIRPAIYSLSLSIEERRQNAIFTLANMSESSIERIGTLATLLTA